MLIMIKPTPFQRLIELLFNDIDIVFNSVHKDGVYIYRPEQGNGYLKKVRFLPIYLEGKKDMKKVSFLTRLKYTLISIWIDFKYMVRNAKSHW